MLIVLQCFLWKKVSFKLHILISRKSHVSLKPKSLGFQAAGEKVASWGGKNTKLSSGKSPVAQPTSLPRQPFPILVCPTFTTDTTENGSSIWILINPISVFSAGSHKAGTEAPQWQEGRVRQVQTYPLLFQFPDWLPLTQLNWWWGEGLPLPGTDAAFECWDLWVVFVACHCEKESQRIKVVKQWRIRWRIKYKNTETSSLMPSP